MFWSVIFVKFATRLLETADIFAPYNVLERLSVWQNIFSPRFTPKKETKCCNLIFTSNYPCFDIRISLSWQRLFPQLHQSIVVVQNYLKTASPYCPPCCAELCQSSRRLVKICSMLSLISPSSFSRFGEYLTNATISLPMSIASESTLHLCVVSLTQRLRECAWQCLACAFGWISQSFALAKKWGAIAPSAPPAPRCLKC